MVPHCRVPVDSWPNANSQVALVWWLHWLIGHKTPIYLLALVCKWCVEEFFFLLNSLVNQLGQTDIFQIAFCHPQKTKFDNYIYTEHILNQVEIPFTFALDLYPTNTTGKLFLFSSLCS